MRIKNSPLKRRKRIKIHLGFHKIFQKRFQPKKCKVKKNTQNPLMLPPSASPIAPKYCIRTKEQKVPIRSERAEILAANACLEWE